MSTSTENKERFSNLNNSIKIATEKTICFNPPHILYLQIQVFIRFLIYLTNTLHRITRFPMFSTETMCQSATVAFQTSNHKSTKIT